MFAIASHAGVLRLRCFSDARVKDAGNSAIADHATAVVDDIAPTVAAIAAGFEFAAESHTPSAWPPKMQPSARGWGPPLPQQNSCAVGRGLLVPF